MSQAKKSFKDEPAMRFISAINEQEQEQAAEQTTVPGKYTIAPRTVEPKTRRLQLVLQPSLYSKVKERAEASGVSVNEYIHQVLEIATKGE